MKRNFEHQAVILSVKDTGGGNRNVIFFSRDEGVQKALLFGGPKSRLKSLTVPFHCGRLWIYRDGVKGIVKITDFFPDKFHSGIRENLVKTMAASLAFETVITTLGGGSDFDKTYFLLEGFLDGIEISSEEGTRYALLRFLWRYMKLLGTIPYVDKCSVCNSIKSTDDNEKMYYYILENTFVCQDCTNFNNPDGIHFGDYYIALPEPVWNFLNSINTETMKATQKLRLPERDFEILKKIIFSMIQKVSPAKLKTLVSIGGML